jgi:hypothetical protein
MITSDLYLTLLIGSRRYIPKKLKKAGSAIAKNYIELFAQYNKISSPSMICTLYNFTGMRPDRNIVSFCFNTTTPVDVEVGHMLNLYLHTINTQNWWGT